MPEFSVVIIARDEEHTLGRALGSLKPLIERGCEVVLLDTGSSDGTLELARAAGCRAWTVGEKFHTSLDEGQADEINQRFMRDGEGPLVESRQRVFNFGAARQYVTSLASHDFVLHLDASDVLLSCDVDFFDEQIRSGQVGNFEYQREYASSDPHRPAILYRYSRFYDRRQYHWEGFVHEGIYPNAGVTPLATVQCSPEKLLFRHIKDEGKQRSFYPGGLALNMLNDPEKPRWMHYLGRELYYLNWRQSAIALLEQHANMVHAWNAERCESLCLAGECYEGLGEIDAASACYSRAFWLDSARRDPLLRLAELCQRQGKHQGCVAYAQAALSIPHTSAYFELETNYTYRPHHLLYISLYWLGSKDEARQHWESCLRYAPDNLRFQLDARWFNP